MCPRAGLAALLLAAGIAPAMADPRCDRIARSMLALNDEPSLRQQMFARVNGQDRLLMEAILLKDGMYMREADTPRWVRSPMSAERRRAAAAKALEAMPLSDCSGPHDVPDVRPLVVAFRYGQANPMAAGGASRGSVWIGKDDGKLRRIVLEDGSYQTIEYGAFSAPIP